MLAAMTTTPPGATAQAEQLPLFYKDIIPLSSQTHSAWRAKPLTKAPFFAQTNVVPLTIDEFGMAQRFYPIIFANNDEATPLGVFGLADGVNAFCDDDGGLLENIYMPAYVRRYPFLLGEREGADGTTLCFDAAAGLLGAFDDGTPLFVDGKPSAATLGILKFCEQMDAAGQRTASFTKLLRSMDLLSPTGASLSTAGGGTFKFDGFFAVDRQKLAALEPAKLAELMKNNALPLIFAHLLSMNLFDEVLNRQVARGKLDLNTSSNAAEATVPS
jgi:SapC